MNHMLPSAAVDAHICPNIELPPVTGRTQRLMRAKLESALLPKRHQPRAERLSTHSLTDRDTIVAFATARANKNETIKLALKAAATLVATFIASIGAGRGDVGLGM